MSVSGGFQLGSAPGPFIMFISDRGQCTFKAFAFLNTRMKTLPLILQFIESQAFVVGKSFVDHGANDTAEFFCQ